MPSEVTMHRRHSLGFAPGNDPAAQWLRVKRSAMACTFEVTLSAEQPRETRAAVAALGIASDLERRLTHFRDDSVLSDLNRRAASEPVIARQPASMFDATVRS